MRRLLVALLLIAAACSGGDGSATTTDPVITTAPSTPISATTTEPRGSASPDAVPITEALRDWSLLAGPSDLITIGVLDLDLDDGAVLVSLGGRATSLLLATTTEARIVHESRIDWTVQEGRYDERRLVVTENDEIFGGVYRLWLYDPLDEQPLIVDASDGGGEAPFFLPTTSLDGNRLAYTAEAADGTTCIRTRFLDDSRDEETVCGPTPSHDVIFPSLSGGTLAYLLIDAAAEPRCDQFVVLRDDEAPEIHEVVTCGAFTGAADDLIAVWTEAAARPDRAPLYGRIAGGATVFLGEAISNHVAVCEGRAYWRSQLSDGQELRSWAPGSDVEILLRRPSLGFPACDGDTVAVYASTGAASTGEILVSSAGGIVPSPVTLEFNP